jgi:hypothetical protein
MTELYWERLSLHGRLFIFIDDCPLTALFDSSVQDLQFMTRVAGLEGIVSVGAA